MKKGLCLVASVVSDPEMLWTAAHQAPLSIGFSRQEYWSGLPYSPPGEDNDPGIESVSPPLAGGFFTTETPGRKVGKKIGDGV